MTRKDYKLIAASIRASAQNIKEWETSGVVRETVEHVCDNLAMALQSDNPRFDRARFVNACTKGIIQARRGTVERKAF